MGKVRAKTHERHCIDCGKVDMIRTDHAHTKRCLTCAHALTLIKPGEVPHNKGDRDRVRPRVCKTCGAEFEVRQSLLDKRPRYAWGSYCDRACYGIAQRTPGSRWSEVGKDYPSRRKRAH